MSCVFCANCRHNCDGNATCQETPGSFTCTCNHGYESLETALGLVPVRWRVDGCTSSTQFDPDPVLTNASLAVGRVVCCRGEYDATRKDSSGACLSGDSGGVGKTFWEAKTICEGEGWRVCRKEELLTSDSAGSCGAGCQYDLAMVWADLNPGEAPEACADCPANADAPAGSADCACNAGFEGPGGAPCSPCAAGYMALFLAYTLSKFHSISTI